MLCQFLPVSLGECVVGDHGEEKIPPEILARRFSGKSLLIKKRELALHKGHTKRGLSGWLSMLPYFRLGQQLIKLWVRITGLNL